MLKHLRSLLKNELGNVTIIFALGAIPLCAAVGAAVDYGRASSAQTALQAATDSAALAVAADPKLSDKAAEQMMNDYLIANGMKNDVAKVVNVAISRDKKKGTVSVDATGTFNTSLMGIVGISNLEIGGHSQVQNGGQALEVALVLDNTFSMSAESRMIALKQAAHGMLGQLLNNSEADTKIAVVPFSDYVNVGMSRRNENWINVKNDYQETLDAYNWVSSNCRQVPVDGVTGVTEEKCDWTQGAKTGTWVKKYTWTGCVGSRNDPSEAALDEKILKPTQYRYPGVLDGEQDGWQDVVCGQEVTSLTKNASKLSTAIDAMVPIGETYIPGGLVWGWNMLDSAEPFAEAKTQSEMTDARGTKVLVLMTDGDNTLKPVYPWHLREPDDPNWGQTANSKTATLCENIKAQGITIYTVALKVSNTSSRQMLEKCASTPEMAFNADNNAALVSAFSNIAGQLVAVHLSK